VPWDSHEYSQYDDNQLFLIDLWKEPSGENHMTGVLIDAQSNPKKDTQSGDQENHSQGGREEDHAQARKEGSTRTSRREDLDQD